MPSYEGLKSLYF